MNFAIITVAFVVIVVIFAIYWNFKESFRVSYGNVNVSGQKLTVQETAQEPDVQIPIKPYLLVLFDKDAPSSRANGFSYLHWLKSNDQNLVAYQGPTPPLGSGTHEYQFNLYANSLEKFSGNRDVFDVDQFGTPLDSIKFYVDS